MARLAGVEAPEPEVSRRVYFCSSSATRSGIRIIASCPVSSSKNFQSGALRYFAANWSKEPVAGDEQ